MRAIKFRGRTANNEWVFGLPHDDAPQSTAYYAEYSQRIAWLPETGGYANCPIKNGTLCQFTGLLDKNGLTEVYEGDILDENGLVKGNVYESPQIHREGIDLVIAEMGTEAWRGAESIAMGRGCKYTK